MRARGPLSRLLAVQILVTCLAACAWAQDKAVVPPTGVATAKKDVLDDNKSFVMLRPEGKNWVSIPDPKAEVQRLLNRGGSENAKLEKEFKAIGAVVLRNISGYLQYVDHLAKFEKLAAAIRDVQVIIPPYRFLLDGVDRQAVNLRSMKVILMTEDYWKMLTHEQKKVIVLHEYLRFCDVDDSAYGISRVLSSFRQMTLIKPVSGNIYHTLEFSKSVWTYQDGDIVDILMDKKPSAVRLVHPQEDDPESALTLGTTESDPVVGAKKIWYAATREEKMTAEERRKFQPCKKKIQAREPLTGFLVGERNINIISCWGPGEKPPR